MCNLYSMTKSQDAIGQLTRAMRDLTGNLAPLPAVFPNRMAPLVRLSPDVGKHLVFSFLTTDASHDVAPIHSDATPVCLFTEDEREMWMNAPVELALTLQLPPARGALRIVAAGSKEDRP